MYGFNLFLIREMHQIRLNYQNPVLLNPDPRTSVVSLSLINFRPHGNLCNCPVFVVVKGIAIGEGDLAFDSRGDQIGHSGVVQALNRGDGSRHSLQVSA